jgi:hypothetical protein
MKNVAGYDVSRVMAGSLGTLGVIAEVSLKVLPWRPPRPRWNSPAARPMRCACSTNGAASRCR